MKKNILITGATDGIGKIVATRLAKEGHTILIHGRNSIKLDNAIKQIKEQSSNDDIHGYLADFSNLNSVNRMADEINNNMDFIDIIINNAGIFFGPEDRTSNGFDMRFQVNYLAPYVLTKELLPLLNKSKAARIINLSSAAQSSISYDAMIGNSTVNINSSYAQSKLALTMWSMHLAELEKNITTIAVNPGSLLNTKMANEAYGQYWSPAEKGSDILYELAIQNEHQNMSGKYYDNDRGIYSTAHGDAYDKNAIKSLISKTEELLQQIK